jgi:hypothetical protein
MLSYRMRAWLGIGPALAWLLAAGCGQSGDTSVQTALRAQLTSVSAMSFNAITSVPSNPAPNVQVTISDPAALDVANAILDLPAMPSGTYNCPEDFGVSYFLVFTGGDPNGGGETVMTANLDPAGCQAGDITSDGQHVDNFWVPATSDFWSRLAGDLGVPEANIYPYLPPTP